MIVPVTPSDADTVKRWWFTLTDRRGESHLFSHVGTYFDAECRAIRYAIDHGAGKLELTDG